MTTPIDRESVERLAFDLEHTDGPDGPLEMIYRCQMADTLRALRAALDAAEAEVKRLREALSTPKAPMIPACDCGMFGPCMHYACRHPLTRAALKETDNG